MKLRPVVSSAVPDSLRRSKNLVLDDLSMLGLINLLKLKFLPEGFGHRLGAELWMYPDGSRILELSTRCGLSAPGSWWPAVCSPESAACSGAPAPLLVSSALVSVSRRWVKQFDPPPSTIAKLKWQQARAATTAGARAWRNGQST